VAGPAAPSLFAIGLLGASLLAAVVVPLSSAYGIAEAAGAERTVSASFRQAPLFFGVFTLQLFIGAGIALAPDNLISLVVHMQVLNGLITPVLLTFVLILANRRAVLGAAANGRAFRLVATVCVGAIGALAVAVVAITVIGSG
jgi:Mn2+/Fe2+ NRAMP family transporter